jgi:nucleotide-binding universal stress UspA family protein
MNSKGARPVVAGVDYSAASGTAVAYAAEEARRRGLGLLLVHGFLSTAPGEREQISIDDDQALIVAAEERLEETTAAVRLDHPDLGISTKVLAGSGGTALVQESASASLVIVGARGRGGFTGLLLGSVATQVSGHARCPVVVVRPALTPAAGVSGSKPVVVGIDSSTQSTEVLSLAFDEAAGRGVGLLAVHVWSVVELSELNVGTVWSHNPATARIQLQASADRVLEEALAGWEQKQPDVVVRRSTVHGDDPAATLMEIAGEVSSELIVVGARGRGGFAGKVLGSVSQALVAHAQSSVAVVHPHQA